MERPLISPQDLSNSKPRSLVGTSFGPITPVRESDLLNFLKKMAFVKHEDWKYEKEWRMICSFKNPSERRLEFPRENVLTGIFFGMPGVYRRGHYLSEGFHATGFSLFSGHISFLLTTSGSSGLAWLIFPPSRTTKNRIFFLKNSGISSFFKMDLLFHLASPPAFGQLFRS